MQSVVVSQSPFERYCDLKSFATLKMHENAFSRMVVFSFFWRYQRIFSLKFIRRNEYYEYYKRILWILHIIIHNIRNILEIIFFFVFTTAYNSTKIYIYLKTLKYIYLIAWLNTENNLHFSQYMHLQMYIHSSLIEYSFEPSSIDSCRSNNCSNSTLLHIYWLRFKSELVIAIAANDSVTSRTRSEFNRS